MLLQIGILVHKTYHELIDSLITSQNALGQTDSFRRCVHDFIREAIYQRKTWAEAYQAELFLAGNVPEDRDAQRNACGNLQQINQGLACGLAVHFGRLDIVGDPGIFSFSPAKLLQMKIYCSNFCKSEFSDI